RLAVVMSISSGNSSVSKVSEVPHRGQKVRVTPQLDANRVGPLATRRYFERGTVNHATIGAPAARRHIEQWQIVGWKGSPPASYRTWPQKHPPLSIHALPPLLIDWHTSDPVIRS